MTRVDLREAVAVDGVILTMTSSTPLARTGSNAVFTLTVHNESSLVAVGVTVYAPLPTGYSLVAANDPRFEKCTGTWSVGSIQPGAESVVQVTALKLPTGSLTYRAQANRTLKYQFELAIGWFMNCSKQDLLIFVLNFGSILQQLFLLDYTNSDFAKMPF